MKKQEILKNFISRFWERRNEIGGISCHDKTKTAIEQVARVMIQEENLKTEIFLEVTRAFRKKMIADSKINDDLLKIKAQKNLSLEEFILLMEEMQLYQY